MSAAKYRRVAPLEVQAIQYLPGPAGACNCAAVNDFTAAGADDCTEADCSEWNWEFVSGDGQDVEANPTDWIVKISEDAFEVHTVEQFADRFEALP